MAREFDPHKLSNPGVFLLTMIIFLIIVAFLAAILYRQIMAAFVTNPGLNGLDSGRIGGWYSAGTHSGVQAHSGSAMGKQFPAGQS